MDIAHGGAENGSSAIWMNEMRKHVEKNTQMELKNRLLLISL